MSKAIVLELLARGVKIPAPEAVHIEDVDVEQFGVAVTIYPGTVIRGRTTRIGAKSKLGAGGGAYVENAQFGENVTAAQGYYRDCTLLDGVKCRTGAEIREGCLLEEGAELGHNVGLKQSILMPNVVAGSLINFCDSLMAGGTSRRDHSEIGSAMALYNYTPNGDKFASLFGDVPRGVFLREAPIFIGGQTQIVSPVWVDYGSVIAAGSKLSHNLGPGRLFVSAASRGSDRPFDPALITRPDAKIRESLRYIKNLEALRAWYHQVRIPAYRAAGRGDELMRFALVRIESGIAERQKRLGQFIEKLPKSLELHRQLDNADEVAAHCRALAHKDAHPISFELGPSPVLSELGEALAKAMRSGHSYLEAIAGLEKTRVFLCDRRRSLVIRQ